MTAFTQTIVNSMNMFGGGLTSQWGVMVWGEDNWGENFPLIFSVQKVVSESLSQTVGFVKFPQHIVSNNQTYSHAVNKGVAQSITNGMSFDTDAVSMVRGSGDFDYVFPGGGTDGNNQALPVYTKAADSSDSFTTFTTASAVWTGA